LDIQYYYNFEKSIQLEKSSFTIKEFFDYYENDSLMSLLNTLNETPNFSIIIIIIKQFLKIKSKNKIERTL
jgi:transposase